MLKIGYDPRYCLDLFVKSVRPILTYNCEILNQIPENKIKAVANGDKQLQQLYFGSPAEKIHLRLCRNILGVSNKMSCLAVPGELGEYPVDIFAYTQMVQYYSLSPGVWQSFVTIRSCNHLMRIISTYVDNTKKSEIS